MKNINYEIADGYTSLAKQYLRAIVEKIMRNMDLINPMTGYDGLEYALAGHPSGSSQITEIGATTSLDDKTRQLLDGIYYAKQPKKEVVRSEATADGTLLLILQAPGGEQSYLQIDPSKANKSVEGYIRHVLRNAGVHVTTALAKRLRNAVKP